MSSEQTSKIGMKQKSYLVSVFIFVYILLFEFVIAPIKYIPKPTILYDSFVSLWDTYDLAGELFTTTTIIYLSLLLSYLLILGLIKYLLKIIFEYPGIFNVSIPFKFFSAFFFAIIFNLWFGESVLGEFLFSFLVVTGLLISSILKSSRNTKDEYIMSGLTIGLSKNNIYKKIIWKAIQPKVFKRLIHIHIGLWTVILVYEFVGGVQGVGSVYYLAYTYNDFAALITLGILVSILIIFGNWIIKFLQKKLIFWE